MERYWGGVKDLKSNRHSALSSAKTEKQAILYCTARINEARIKQAAKEKIGAKETETVWGDDDIR